MNDINTIYKMLDWNNDEETQLKGIEYAVKMHRIDIFIQPITSLYSKNIWDNCAKILYCKTDDELKDYLPYLFEWIQDINWPGAFTICNRINTFKNREFVHSLREKYKSIAMKNDDQVWLDNLDMIN